MLCARSKRLGPTSAACGHAPPSELPAHRINQQPRRALQRRAMSTRDAADEAAPTEDEAVSDADISPAARSAERCSAEADAAGQHPPQDAPAPDTPAAAPGTLTLAPTNLGDKISALKRQQAEYLAQRKKVSQELRNAERKRRRLKERARGLSDADLAQVIAMRASGVTDAAARATADAGMEPAAHSKRRSDRTRAPGKESRARASTENR